MHILKSKQNKMKLDIDLSQAMSSKKNKGIHETQMQMQMMKKVSSQKVNNALCDLNEKRNQIIYL